MIAIGQSVRVRGKFKKNGAFFAPTTIGLTIKAPDNSETVFAIGDLTNESLGVYSKVMTATASGRWTLTWTSTGPAVEDVGRHRSGFFVGR